MRKVDIHIILYTCPTCNPTLPTYTLTHSATCTSSLSIAPSPISSGWGKLGESNAMFTRRRSGLEWSELLKLPAGEMSLRLNSDRTMSADTLAGEGSGRWPVGSWEGNAAIRFPLLGDIAPWFFQISRLSLSPPVFPSLVPLRLCLAPFPHLIGGVNCRTTRESRHLSRAYRN